MGDIIKLPTKRVNKEAQDCEVSQVIDEYLEIVSECETREDLHVNLHNLYMDAYREGYKQALIDDISAKADVLDMIDEEEY